MLRPTLEEDNVQDFLNRAGQALEAKGGRLVSVDRWGKRRLAYEIQDQREAHYVLLHIQAPPVGGTAELEHICHISEDVLRHLIVLEQEGAAGSPKPEPIKTDDGAVHVPSGSVQPPTTHLDAAPTPAPTEEQAEETEHVVAGEP